MIWSRIFGIYFCFVYGFTRLKTLVLADSLHRQLDVIANHPNKDYHPGTYIASWYSSSYVSIYYNVAMNQTVARRR
jgi:hypothetical protein